MELKRFENNPILSPNPDNAWENFAATNPGAWYDEKRAKYTFFTGQLGMISSM